MREVLFRKSLVFIIIILFLIAGSISSAGIRVKTDFIQDDNKPSETYTSQTIIYVDDDNTEGPWEGTIEHPYQNIHDGVENAYDGDTIYVLNGNYIGFTSKKKLDFIGENNENTIIKVWWSNEEIILDADGINFDNFKVIGRYVGYHHPLLWARGNNIKILNCNIIADGTDTGIRVGGQYDYLCNYYKSNIIVSDCNIQGCSSGAINFYLSYNCIARNCTLYNNGAGILLEWLSGGPCGQLYKNSNHHVYNCDISNNRYGVKIHDGDGNYVSNCLISNNTRGIYLVSYRGTDKNKFTSSTIVDNEYGFSFYGDENEVLGNIISKNRYGIYLNDKSDNNKFRHNNIMNNTDYNAMDLGNNIWDYSKEGNYWSDYDGIDANGDGIGDTPYLIIEQNSDDYPLMIPYNMFNKPPLKPNIAFNSTLHQWATGTFYSLSYDLNYDSLFYFFDWGDGTTSGWLGPFGHKINCIANHKWTSNGRYFIKVKTRDIEYKESDWSGTVTMNIINNNRPEKPQIFGLLEGIIGVNLIFSVVTTDKDSDKVRYYFHNGDSKDEDPSKWTEYYNSGEIVNISQKYGDFYNKIKTEKSYNITVKAQDINGADSEMNFFRITIKNNPPIAPIIIEIPDKIKIRERFKTVVRSGDYDGHKIAYEVEWGNGDSLTTNIFVDSWENYTIDSEYSGYYSSSGNYSIKIKAYDYYGAESNWTVHILKVEEKRRNLGKNIEIFSHIRNIVKVMIKRSDFFRFYQVGFDLLVKSSLDQSKHFY